MSSASIIPHVICLIAGLWLGMAQPALAQGHNSLSGERICPDGKRAYFGVCPDDEDIKPAPSMPVTNPAPPLAIPAPTPPPKTCDYCPEMVRLPGGQFMMGSNNGNKDEKPVHRVTVVSFAIGKYEVTQGQWQAVMGNNPSFFTECGDDCPVEKVSYNDIQDYLVRLNRLTAGRYRLPTEAEWEYACRAGGNHEYCGSDDADEVGWYIGNSGIRTHIVGIKQANTFGLYDMSGNVMEWTCSAYTKNGNGYDGSEKLCTDDARVESVIRGGSWFSARALLRSANSTWGLRDFGHFNLGFRLAQDK